MNGDDFKVGKKVYENKNTDLGALTKNLEQWFSNQGYIVESNSGEGVWAVQAKKDEKWRKALGASRAFKVNITGNPNLFTVEVGTGEWASNLTAVGVGALLTGGVSIIGSGIATGWSKKIEGDIMEYLDELVLFGQKEKNEDEKFRDNIESSMQQKMNKLKDAYNSGIIDEKEYKLKVQEIEKSYNSEKNNMNKEKQLEQLKGSFDAGILTLGEYEAKKAELFKSNVKNELEEQLTTLKIALANGILSQSEFDEKKAVLEKENNLKIELKKLEDALYSGLINRDQFEEKKLALMNKNMDSNEKIRNLEMALENNIISREEFEAKKKIIEQEPIIKEKLEKLKLALNAGVISREEFELKKAQIGSQI